MSDYIKIKLFAKKHGSSGVSYCIPQEKSRAFPIAENDLSKKLLDLINQSASYKQVRLLPLLIDIAQERRERVHKGVEQRNS